MKRILIAAALMAGAGAAHAQPVMTRAGGIASPTGAYSIDQAGNAIFSTLGGGATVGGTSLSTIAGQAAASLPAAKVGLAGGVSPLNSCAVRPSRSYAGAIIGSTDLASAANVPNLQAGHNTSFYLTSYALTQVSGLSVAAVQATWTSQAAGIIEVGTDPAVMPDIAANYGSYVTGSHNWTWGGVKGATWPSLIAAGGWAPRIAMLNEFLLGTTNSLSDPYYLMDLAAIADVKKAAPSIQYVLPYLTANAAPVTAANNDTDWTDTYWGESRAIAMAGGGLGVDTPANYFNVIREPGFRTLTAQEIRWATSNGLLSVVLLSPYDLAAAPGTTPQFQYDPTFMQAVQQEVSFLHSQGADPTFYVVANYSEGAGTNPPGSDTDPSGETVDAVALWVARNAPTSPMPATAPASVQAEPAVPCAPELIANRASSRLLSSDVDGLGAMAWQASTAVNIGGGSVTGLSALSLLSTDPLTLGSDGSVPFVFSTDGVGNVTAASTNSTVTPNFNLAANLNLPGGQSITLNSTGAHPGSVYADGVGNVNVSTGLANGNFNLNGNARITGALTLNSGSTYPLTISDDGVGGSTISNGLAGGNIKFNENIQFLGTQSLYFDAQGTTPASLSGDGLGDLIATGNEILSGNLTVGDGKSVVFAPPSGGSSCYFFHDDSKAGLVYQCGSTRLMRIPDNGSAPIFMTAPVVGTP